MQSDTFKVLLPAHQTFAFWPPTCTRLLHFFEHCLRLTCTALPPQALQSSQVYSATPFCYGLLALEKNTEKDPRSLVPQTASCADLGLQGSEETS